MSPPWGTAAEQNNGERAHLIQLAGSVRVLVIMGIDPYDARFSFHSLNRSSNNTSTEGHISKQLESDDRRLYQSREKIEQPKSNTIGVKLSGIIYNSLASSTMSRRNGSYQVTYSANKAGQRLFSFIHVLGRQISLACALPEIEHPLLTVICPPGIFYPYEMYLPPTVRGATYYLCTSCLCRTSLTDLSTNAALHMPFCP